MEKLLKDLTMRINTIWEEFAKYFAIQNITQKAFDNAQTTCNSSD